LELHFYANRKNEEKYATYGKEKYNNMMAIIRDTDKLESNLRFHHPWIIENAIKKLGDLSSKIS